MNMRFAQRMMGVDKSFIREILKVTENPEIISFAGGLPNPAFFPVEPIARAADKVLRNRGAEALQYRTTEGSRGLREWIAHRYQRKGVTVCPEDILITTGSQQGLDLVGKVFLDPGDRVILERPGYLGAIQALGMYQAKFVPVTLDEDGANIDGLQRALCEGPAKLYYAVTNFQNPSGISYTSTKRQAVAEAVRRTDTILVEDDPYGELRFRGEPSPSMGHYLPEQTILLGSFSKIAAPGLRLGWVCARAEVMDKLVVAKQGADLHSGYLAQRILEQYLADNDIDEHIARIRQAYGSQRDVMIESLARYCPPEIHFTQPEGGMFLWGTLPAGLDSVELFQYAIEAKVAFVPGHPFYVDGGGSSTLRLNYSNSSQEKIEEGVRRLGQVIENLMRHPGRCSGACQVRPAGDDCLPPVSI